MTDYKNKRSIKYTAFLYDISYKSKTEIRMCVSPKWSPEYNVAKYFESKGYNVSIPSSRNNNGVPDILIKKNNEIFYIEVKSNKAVITLNQFDFWITKSKYPVKVLLLPYSWAHYIKFNGKNKRGRKSKL
jgi:hypothetical protein